jgi:2-polyprenyl-6-methoxyphenol hydroxylase-like FAD-dependent oxidoreductase
MGANGASQAILDTVTLAEALETTGTGDIENALKTYEAARLGPTAEVVYSKRRYGPEAILQIVEERISSADDRLEDVITHEEIDEITLAYRKVAGFEVEELNSLDVE